MGWSLQWFPMMLVTNWLDSMGLFDVICTNFAHDWGSQILQTLCRFMMISGGFWNAYLPLMWFINQQTSVWGCHLPENSTVFFASGGSKHFCFSRLIHLLQVPHAVGPCLVPVAWGEKWWSATVAMKRRTMMSRKRKRTVLEAQGWKRLSCFTINPHGKSISVFL